MVSGNYKHPADIFPGRTTFEVRRENATDYLSLGNAVQSGRLDVAIEDSMNPVSEVCVRFNENGTSWLLINEVCFLLMIFGINSNVFYYF